MGLYGEVVSGGQVRVQQAQKLRKVGRQLTAPTYGWGLIVPTYGNTLRLPPGGVGDIPVDFCRGVVHSDIVCGKVLDDDLYCQWGYTYEQLTRYLCCECRRTDSPPQQAHCRDACPGKQRQEGGRPARSQHLPFMGGAGWGREKRKWKPGTEKLMKQRYVKARFYSIMAAEGQQRVDEATVLAAVGRLRAGGTAIGTFSHRRVK